MRAGIGDKLGQSSASKRRLVTAVVATQGMEAHKGMVLLSPMDTSALLSMKTSPLLGMTAEPKEETTFMTGPSR